jgi:hypothetical protein
VVVGSAVVVAIPLQEFSALIRPVRLAWVEAAEVMWRAKLRIIGVDALWWQVSRRNYMRP